MGRPTYAAAVLIAVGLVGCGSGSSSSKGSGSATTQAAISGAPGSVNVLQASTAAPSSASSSSGSAPAAGAAGAAGAAAAPASPATGAVVYGTIPPDPTTGFNGSLYLVGERLVPGSVVQVTVNGTPLKVLPALFHSSELLSIPVWFTVAADYEFAALAPDGTLSQAVQLTVPDGGVQSVFGLGTPDVQMAFPASLPAGFSGTVWLMGAEFVPGCMLTVTPQGQTPYVAPLLYVNDRTVGWVVAAPPATDVTLQVTNPTLLTSQALTLSVQGTQRQAGGAPQVYAPASVSSPFVGTVHLNGQDLEPGATAELRLAGGAQALSVPLIRVSSVEAWLTLVYPQPGSYELRVVNPGGAASPWSSFDVR